MPIKVHLTSGAGPFPVVVVSHGAGGDRDTHFGQARDLAARGYVVLCVDHVGSDRDRLKTGGLRMMKTIEAMTRDADEVLTRPRDVGFALDRATEWNRTHERLRGTLDLRRVAVMGHSYGPGHRLVWLANARHNDFTSSPTTAGASLPSATREESSGRRARRRSPSSTST